MIVGYKFYQLMVTLGKRLWRDTETLSATNKAKFFFFFFGSNFLTQNGCNNNEVEEREKKGHVMNVEE